jgi:hypothetical protein
MKNSPRLAIMALAAVIAGLMIAGTAEAADTKDVKLTLTVSSAGTNWQTVNESSHNQLFWELRYDPGKGGGTANYFGDVDIECGTTAIKVQPDKKPDFPYAQWPYTVTVYACVDGVKGQELANIDPRIVWRD